MSEIYRGEGQPIETFVFPSDVVFHHTALQRGYCSRKSDGFVEPYAGRFGVGFKVHRPYWRSSAYHQIDYYVQVGHK